LSGLSRLARAWCASKSFERTTLRGCPCGCRAISRFREQIREVTVEEQNERLAVRTDCKGVGGKVFQAVGVAVPPAIREI